MLRGGVSWTSSRPSRRASRKTRGRCGDGARAGAGRHSPRRRRGAYERPGHGRGDQGGRTIRSWPKPASATCRGTGDRGPRCDYVDESEVLTTRREANHIDKWAFTVPFVCGATNLGEALRRISEGAALIRSKGEAGTGDIQEAVPISARSSATSRAITQADATEQYTWAKELPAHDRPCPGNRRQRAVFRFRCSARVASRTSDVAAGDAAAPRALFVRVGIFKSADPARARRPSSRRPRRCRPAHRGQGEQRSGRSSAAPSPTGRRQAVRRGW